MGQRTQRERVRLLYTLLVVVSGADFVGVLWRSPFGAQVVNLTNMIFFRHCTRPATAPKSALCCAPALCVVFEERLQPPGGLPLAAIPAPFVPMAPACHPDRCIALSESEVINEYPKNRIPCLHSLPRDPKEGLRDLSPVFMTCTWSPALLLRMPSLLPATHVTAQRLRLSAVWVSWLAGAAPTLLADA
jgi:hypothetical protein